MKNDHQDELVLQVEDMLGEVFRFQALLEEGKRGHHILFKPEMIRMTFEHPHEELTELLENQIDEINRVINESFDYASLEDKQNFFASQPKNLQKALVYGYFQLIDSQMTPAEKTLH
ncbi:MAG: hypothetical protein KDD46_05000 [Bdellovibrionales bacterium]|nr:hypothetical protein [Bdellovibrionales bacterium]